MDSGKIVEPGYHDEILTGHGVHFELVTAQFAAPAANPE